MQIWDGAYINIDKGLLQTGDNTVAIRFTNKYAVDGNGLHCKNYIQNKFKEHYIYPLGRQFTIDNDPIVKKLRQKHFSFIEGMALLKHSKVILQFQTQDIDIFLE